MLISHFPNISLSPRSVANILSNYGVDHLPTLMAAILHDTVEDTDTTLHSPVMSEYQYEAVSDSMRDPLLRY
jgi:(p)ppGpp synthase/HD superfamily hydrolase